MAGGKNLASKYSTSVDERFSRESQAMLALNNDYEFTGRGHREGVLHPGCPDDRLQAYRRQPIRHPE